MSLATHSPLSSSSPDTIMEVSRESEQIFSVSYLNCLPLAFADNHQIQDSSSGLFANAQNVLITGGTFVVSLSCGLFKQIIIAQIRTIFYLPTGKGIRSLYFKNQTPVHYLLDGKKYLTSFR